MNNTTILLIEGRHADHPAFTSALRKRGLIVEQVSNGSEAISRLDAGFIPAIIVVNAASLRSNGKRICQSLREKEKSLPILLILHEDHLMENLNADAILVLPFTAQKLVNRIRHLLPGDGRDCIAVGSICLDVEKRMVQCAGKQARLTPRLVHLLKALMERAGEVYERKALFSKVWETDYTDDTRTLDVHISWLRQAIETDPDIPHYLKTIRGVGYRLDA